MLSASQAHAGAELPSSQQSSAGVPDSASVSCVTLKPSLAAEQLSWPQPAALPAHPVSSGSTDSASVAHLPGRCDRGCVERGSRPRYRSGEACHWATRCWESRRPWRSGRLGSMQARGRGHFNLARRARSQATEPGGLRIIHLIVSLACVSGSVSPGSFLQPSKEISKRNPFARWPNVLELA